MVTFPLYSETTKTCIQRLRNTKKIRKRIVSSLTTPKTHKCQPLAATPSDCDFCHSLMIHPSPLHRRMNNASLQAHSLAPASPIVAASTTTSKSSSSLQGQREAKQMKRTHRNNTAHRTRFDECPVVLLHNYLSTCRLSMIESKR